MYAIKDSMIAKEHAGGDLDCAGSVDVDVQAIAQTEIAIDTRTAATQQVGDRTEPPA